MHPRAMQDRVVVVTGANAGLGYQLALNFARTGAHVVMACRSQERGRAARERLLGELPEARATLLPLDLSELASVREFARLFAEEVGELDILINNAGIFGVPLSYNSAGHELQLATNYLGPFALTGLLLPHLRDVAGARIVNVGSLGHRLGKLRLAELRGQQTDQYSPFRAYARSKVALLSHTMELNRRLQQQGRTLIALGAHPGMAPTDIGRHHAVANPKTLMGKWFTRKMEELIPRIHEAAEPIMHAACAEQVEGGEYYGPGGWFEVGGAPAKARANALARDQALARELWSLSESLTGLRYLSGNGS